MLATALPRGEAFGARLMAIAIAHLSGLGRPGLEPDAQTAVVMVRVPETEDISLMHVKACAIGRDARLEFRAVVVEAGQYANVVVVACLTASGRTERWEGRMRQSGAGFIEVVTLVPVQPA